MEESLLFSLDGRVDLAKSIIENANYWSPDNQIKMGYLNTQQFSDGEFSVDYTSSIRGKKVYILSSPNNSNEIIKLNLTIDAAKRSAAKEIIVVLPFFPYQRSDKKDQSRGAIGAKILAEMIENRGATSVITYDLHADQIQGFFNIPVRHIEGKNVFDDYIESICTKDTILCGPDAGSGKRVKRTREHLNKYHGINLNIVMLDKTRKEANVIDEMIIIGDVTGKDVIILDDMVDTAGTLCTAAQVIMDSGAKSVKAIISHPICSGPALARINESVLTELVVSDSLEKRLGNDGITSNNKIKVISVAKQIGFVIAAINNNVSYNALKNTKRIR